MRDINKWALYIFEWGRKNTDVVGTGKEYAMKDILRYLQQADKNKTPIPQAAKELTDSMSSYNSTVRDDWVSTVIREDLDSFIDSYVVSQLAEHIGEKVQADEIIDMIPMFDRKNKTLLGNEDADFAFIVKHLDEALAACDWCLEYIFDGEPKSLDPFKEPGLIAVTLVDKAVWDKLHNNAYLQSIKGETLELTTEVANNICKGKPGPNRQEGKARERER